MTSLLCEQADTRRPHLCAIVQRGSECTLLPNRDHFPASPDQGNQPYPAAVYKIWMNEVPAVSGQLRIDAAPGQ